MPPSLGRLAPALLLTAIITFASASAQAAVLSVTSTQDTGADSLRAAVALAAPGDTIHFNIPTSDTGYNAVANIFTITLASGEIVIDKDLTIAGPSAANVALSGNHTNRIFNVITGTVAISNLSIVNGTAKGADGSPTGSDEEANGRPGTGGAVLNQGTLSFERCTFTDNAAIGGAGATRFVISGGSGGAGQGGAIANQGTLSLTACTLASNSATGGTSGIGGFEIKYSAPGGKGSGGAVYTTDTSILSLINCTITDNTARGADVSYIGINSAGGAAGQGGGIANLGTLAIAHSTLANNTVVGGDSIGHPGFFSGTAFGGGLFNATGSVSSVRDAIFAPNTALGGNAGAGVATGPDVNGAVISQGHNLLGRSDGCTGFTTDDLQGGTTNVTRLDPKLGTLANYGGVTDTLPLLPDSPAINAADNAAPERDQRGFVRAGTPDIGAFEYQGTQPVMLANIATRLRVQPGDNALIGGFIISGTQPKTVVIRGIGPSLPVPGALADPIIDVYDATGVLRASNDNWNDAETRQQIIDSGLAPTNDLESALWGVISPGAYTVVVRGQNDATGIGLFEVYDLDRTVNSKLANISTRGFVQTDNDIMIGGFIVLGPDSQKVIVRAVGPSLPVPGALGNPTLELHDGNGALLAANDDWRSDQEAEIIATSLAPSNNLESAIVRTLTPGGYTAIVRGTDNTTGIALVEVYSLN